MAQCLECIAEAGTSREFKTLVSHLGKHVLSVEDYRAKYGPDVDVGYVIGPRPPKPAATADDVMSALEMPAIDPNEAVTTSFDAAERRFFDERFKFLMRSAEDDRALESQVRDIVMGEITLIRYQKELAKITGSIGTASGLKRLGDAKALQTLIKELRTQNLADIKSLNLTREQKQAQRKSVETTPSRLLSRYAQFIAALSPDQLARQREDELEAATRYQINVRRLLDLIPQDVIPSEETLGEEDDEDAD